MFDVYNDGDLVIDDIVSIFDVHDEADLHSDMYHEEDAKPMNILFGVKVFDTSLNITCSNALTKTLCGESFSAEDQLKYCVIDPSFQRSQLLSYVKYYNTRNNFLKIFERSLKFDIRDWNWAIFIVDASKAKIREWIFFYLERSDASHLLVTLVYMLNKITPLSYVIRIWLYLLWVKFYLLVR